MGKKYGFSFSAKRALGITKVKQKIARKTGIPTTKVGRQRKFGSMMGCCVIYPVMLSLTALIVVLMIWLI